MKILVSITTTRDAKWTAKIKEAENLRLKEIALFVTCLTPVQRRQMYKKLKSAGIKKIPFVHLRSDCSPAEIVFLMKEFGTKVFNIHSQKEFPLKYDLSAFRQRIYLENTWYPIADEAADWAGVCLDVSHQENKLKTLDKNHALIKDVKIAISKHPVGIWHLNAIRKKPFNDLDNNHAGYDCHTFTDLSELDYCRKYRKHLPKYYIALELENSLAQQLAAKEYVKKILNIN